MSFLQRIRWKKISDQDPSYQEAPPDARLKRATRVRNVLAWFTSFCLLVAVIFLILVEVGSTHNKPVLTNIWFVKLDLSNVVPVSVPNSRLLNSIAQSLGLHDFYQVGLWSYCEAYTQGVTDCSKPETLYWFNPVEIISSELISGAEIALPSKLSSILNIIRIASHWMFGLFLTGTVLSFVLMLFLHLAVYSRWISFGLAILTLLNALFITAASIIATVLSVVIKDVLEDNTTVNIGVKLGVTMFVCMWFAAGSAITAFLFQLGMTCCCTSRRDVNRGLKKGSEKAYS